MVDKVRLALASGPLDLLGLASTAVHQSKPDPWTQLKSPEEKPFPLDALIAVYSGTDTRETTVMLTVLAELLPDDEELQARCRTALASRTHLLPAWLRHLSDIWVHRAVRRTHVLGDRDELWLGARLTGGQELTCAVAIDHNEMSEVADVVFWTKCIDDVMPGADEHDGDSSIVDMSLADARAWIHHGLERALFFDEYSQWPGCRPLVRWLIRHLPEGGTAFYPPFWKWEDTAVVLGQFFESTAGRRFRGSDYRELLTVLLESGTADPLRWSRLRIRGALSDSSYCDHDLQLEVLINAPELLRAYVPFAHAQSGIRDGLTAEALTAIDESAPGYHEEVIKWARDHGDLFDEEVV
ncbi:hypothetical protein [Mycolicibacterium arseniciresistens]|uniref:Uncharacterized protein n=1 Tax=Mycolicibacterium arseniciresistens TaxID=3062257 RepID=A0ABT8U9E4_9MYCO|nr:hypothetical protein [Mycolicibacterium arseniciresistens]MDO3634416.1 hypothetical protein [Mycolicibacterium arseniciresistens]